MTSAPRIKLMPSTLSSAPWNPERYLTFASERTQPFIDLLTHARAYDPRRIVDLGCGPGNGMPVLREFWPEAEIIGIDSSPEMLQRAQESTSADPRISYQQTDIRDFQLDEPADLIVSNAALQWIPEHRDLLPQIQANVAPGGTLAVQVPGNFSAPSHRLLAELAASEPYRQFIDPHTMLQPTAEVSDYMLDVAAEGWEVEGWETRYHHVLHGEDPVFTWISSAAARPVLEALPEGPREEFTRQYKASLRKAYPKTKLGTILSFRRLFFIARHQG